MQIVFLTPFAALVAVAAVLPLAAAVWRERRDGRIRRALGLARPGRAARFGSTVAGVVLVACLSAAAAQPAVRTARPVPARTDAQVVFVLDVSRSMGAAASAHGPDRFDRARAIAIRLRRSLSTVPAGVASMTDRVLPHLFPSPDERVFASVLHRSIGLGRPTSASPVAERSTDLQSLQALQTGYFTQVPRRLAIVLTDGESDPFEARSLAELLRYARIKLLLVRVWGAHEAIPHDNRYRPDRASTARLATLAPFLAGGRIFDEK